MEKFIQFHILTSYPPSNLNRDDLGRPKTAKMGGQDRLRVSSQSLKRAWRTSEVFESALAGHIGKRTKLLGKELYQQLIENDIKEKDAKEWSRQIAGLFGKLKSEDKKHPERNSDLEIEQLAHISPEEQKTIDELVTKLIKEKRGPKDKELIILRKPKTAVDIALFGRMLAANPKYNIDAACQVSHAISVHPVVIEDDYFTAVDDLNKGDIDRGAGHLGETGFASALFYTYVCVDRDLLIENLGGDVELTNRAIQSLLETSITVAPTGKQNSFASRAYASYILLEKGSHQPRSLAVAFLKPIDDGDYGMKAVEELERTYKNMDKVYEINEIQRVAMNAFTGKGKLSDLISFIKD